MPQLSDLSEPTNILYCGDGGTGKTTHLAAMANLGKIWAVNAEQGMKARALRRRGINVDNIEVWPAPGELITYDGLFAEWVRLREELAANPTAYAGIMWDPVSEIQKVFVEDEAAAAVSRADRSGRERNPFVKDRDNWNIANDQLRSLIRKFRDLPCHFGMTSLLRREQDDDGAVTYQPNVTPALQNDIYGWMDVVCVTSVSQVGDQDEYLGLFRPHGKYRGKDREGGVLPKWLVDPTFDRIQTYLDETLIVDKDPIMQAAKKRAADAAKTEAAAA